MTTRFYPVSYAIAALACLALTAPAAQAAPACKKASHLGSGIGHGPFGVGTKNARKAATADWEAKSVAAHGSKYGSLAKARGASWKCTRNIKEARCEVRARPCR